MIPGKDLHEDPINNYSFRKGLLEQVVNHKE